jgi:hypothetical protein
MTRPSEFAPEVAEAIAESLCDGMSMRQICELDGMPNRSTVARWMAENEDFAASIARARELQADHMDDLILETANACTEETAKSDKVRIWAYQWRAAKLKPKVYGEKTNLDLSNSDGTLAGLITASYAAK